MKCPSCKGVGTVNGIFNCPSCKGIGIIKNKQVDSNEMPELKAGMIVELDFGLKGLCVPVDNGSILVIEPNGENICIDGRDIQKIYYIRKGFNFVSFIKNDQISPAYKLIWSKPKSKIEEIEQTILKLQQEVKELKNDN